MQIIQEKKYLKTSIDVELCKFDAKLKKITLDIDDFKKNDRASAEWHKLTTARLESISNKCDRIESKSQVQDDGMADLSIANINDQLKILKNDVLEIFNNTNLFSTNLARSDSERKKLKNYIIAHVDQIHKNYEPNLPMARHYTPLNKENLSVKEILTPF
ncbi:hypothetical protein O181_104386 [Austropuccinia psidii MF-1]|uniref:Uncharacterized protein n=1 Tax=Austropuccinia psidii MF-1 TaxID=1389203 RepID=A0A9Q3JMH8_9BASI|nr:hypothetical protein [Austropuccinia psidii MF-1]